LAASKTARPNIDPDGNLSADEEARLYQHYGLDYGPVAPGTAPVAVPRPGRTLWGCQRIRRAGHR